MTQGMVGTFRSKIPATGRALANHLGAARDPRVFAVVLLRNEVESEIESMTERLFLGVERDLDEAREAGEVELAPGAADEGARFDYDTRLVLPAMLTLGRIHAEAGDVPVARLGREVDYDLVSRGRETTRNVVRALLDGDMRDAINDDEYEDFQTNLRPREKVAELAQQSLREGVEAWFDREDTPEAVRESYDHAVELSERHQDEDEAFRDLLDRLRAAEVGDREAVADEVRERYKFAPVEEGELFDEEADLPYFATQYARVGILYEDMLNMYEADLGMDLGEGFKRAIVLMVVGAQIGLDDTDDYPEDRGTQLTPVTAELNLAPDRETGVERIRDIVETYLDRADACADPDDHLTRIAVEYIRQQSLDRIDRLGR
ncbi:hypothetical protein NGM10_02935 [Halorussus salilacus]|uniref:hypothetical protein n=1 Tax=Halorussus salilacus TaxID=2953750 RepID=UPI00209F5C7D|nr:hypothetical protein [Halorussus salilacus]USZ68702.1 hypothetical protein NGM10_02935 [Halorussus salilacus]